MPTNRPLSGTFAVALLLAIACGSATAEFNDNTIVVLRLGDGNGSISDAAQKVFLDEHDSATGALIASHPVPYAGPDTLTIGGQADHDGHLTLSSNGWYLLFGGYRADADAASPVTQAPDVINRVIGRVDQDWNVDTSTALDNAYDQCEITAVVSDNGSRFWTVGEGKYDDPTNIVNDFQTPTTTGGLRYVPALGASTSINLSHVQTITYDETGKVVGLWPDSIRSTRIVDDQLYITTPAPESFVNRGAYRTEAPLPTAVVDTPQTMIGVITNTEGQGSDPKGKFVPKSDVVFLDLSSSVPGLDTAYSTGGKDDYEKWALVDSAWVKLSNRLLPSGQEINALDACVAEDLTVTLFASTDEGVYRLIDTSGYNADFSSTFPADPFITPPGNTQFRGIALLHETIPCDANGDGDVDGEDLAVFQACVSGPAVPYAGDCAMWDLDDDHDIDQSDFGVFQRCYSGENQPGDPDCAD